MIKRYLHSSIIRRKRQLTTRYLALILFIIITSSALTFSGAYALFTDTATSIGNTFTAATSFDTSPTPTLTVTPTTTITPTPSLATLSFSGPSEVAVGEEFTLNADVLSHGLSLTGATLQILFPDVNFVGLLFTPGTLFTNILTAGVIGPGTAQGIFVVPPTPPPTAGANGVMSFLKLRALSESGSPATIEYDNSTEVTATESGGFVTGIKNPFLVAVTVPSRTVVINEINWAGSSASTADEWIELRNTTNSDIDAGGWKIVNLAGASPNNVFEIDSGIIPANGYFLISNYNSTSGSSILNISPDIFDTSVNLDSDDGEQLILKNNLGTTIDVANISNHPTDWFAGVNSPTPKKSMERKSPPGDGSLPANWETANTQVNLDPTASESATPKAAN